MFNISDLIILLVIAVAALLGYKRGFIKTSFRMLSFIVAITISLIFYKPVAGYIKENTKVSEWIIQTITTEETNQDEKADYVAEEDLEKENNNDTVIDENGSVVENLEAKYEITEEMKNALQNLPQNIKEYIGVNETINQAKDQLAIKIADAIINVMSLICIYLITKLVLMFVCFILDGIMQIPLLKQINEILGLILGLILGIIQVYTILAVVTFLSSFVQMPELVAYIKSSLIASVLFEYNLLIALIF